MNELSLIINGSKEKKYPDNISLLEISKDFQDEYQTPIIVAMVDGNLKDLTYVLNSSKNNCRIDFFDLTSELGNKVYQRSLIFLLIVAAKEIFPRAKLTIENSLSQGIYCKIKIDPALTRKELLKIENRMKEYVEKDLPFTKKVLPTQEVIDLYNNHDMEDKALLLQQLKNPVSSVYYLFFRKMEENQDFHPSQSA